MITLVIAGMCIGFVVGVTGVGGGSLMTPFLLWYGIAPSIAVGTDLLYAALTKCTGIVAHHRQGHVRWPVVLTLASTSIPASIITLVLLRYLVSDQETLGFVIKTSLGVMLLGTGLALLWNLLRKPESLPAECALKTNISKRQRLRLLMIGAPLGTVVTISSVGAGVVGTMLLMLILPHLRGRDIVGTDLAHAVPLTFVAGVGHYLLMDNVDWSLLLALLIGSLPAVYVGSYWSRRLSEVWLRIALSVCLIGIGGYYLVSGL